MKLIDNEAYWEIEEVTDACELHQKTILVGINRGASCWQALKLPDDLRRTWIRHSTLQAKYQTMLSNKYCEGMNPVDWKKMQEMRGDLLSSWDVQETLEDLLEEACQTDYKLLWKHYEKQVETTDSWKREKQIKCLCRAASILDTVLHWIESQGLKYSNMKVYSDTAEWLKTCKYFEFKYIPNNPQRIREKLDLMVKEGLKGKDVISLPRAGNDNRNKFDATQKKEIQGLVVRQMISGKGWSDQQIIRMVRKRFMLWNEDVPSEATVRRLMNEPKIKKTVATMRYDGNAKGGQKMRFSTPLARAMFAGDCWEMDGTKVQWEGFDVDGVKRSLYIVVCRDVYSGAYLGWSYGLAENSVMYWESIKMAVDIASYLPCELRVDKFAKTQSLDNLFVKMQGLGVRYTVGHTSNSKAFTERGFKTLQEVFESEEKMWIGEGILSGDENSKPTAQYIAQNQKRLKQESWNWDAAWTKHNALMMAYNATPLSHYSKRYKDITQSPLALHNTCEKSSVIKLEIWDKPSLFWAEEIRDFPNYQLHFERRGEGKITFDFADKKYLDIHLNYKKVMVRYDMDTLDEVLIFDPVTDKFLASEKRFEKIQLYGSNPEYGRNAEYQAKRKSLQSAIKQAREDILDGSTREVDESALRMGALIAKDEKEQAEQAAMESYRLQSAPKSKAILHSSKKQKESKLIEKPKVNIYQDDVEIDVFQSVMNQL